MEAEMPTVVILCGGRGARLQERTQSIPKPLVEIGGRPIVWHVIQICGRLRRAAEAIGGSRFCATYADGVADIDLKALLREHARHGATGTMTVVRPELQFGVAELNGDGVVRGFVEKPRSEHWINGGFFCFEAGVLELLSDDSVLEREPLAELAAQGRLWAFRHEGFWDCMDTYKDAVLLEDLWSSGKAPWKLWS
jgi:glucose-1-phosphate cytidylyltransferase